MRPFATLALLIPLLAAQSAGAQTLPSVPQLAPGRSLAAQVQGGLTLTHGEVESLMITTAQALAYGGDRIKANLRGYLVFVESRQGSPAAEIDSDQYAVETSIQMPLTGPLYVVVNGDWERDQSHGIDHRLSGTAGVGATVLTQPTFQLDVEGSGGLIREDLTEAGVESFAAVGALARTRWTLSGTTSLSAEMELLANVENSDDVRLYADAALSTAVAGPVSLTLSYVVKHDSEPSVIFDPFDDQVTPVPAEGTVGVIAVQLGVAF